MTAEKLGELLNHLEEMGGLVVSTAPMS